MYFTQMKGNLQTVVNYLFNQKKELMAFLEDGQLDVSNNLAEKSLEK